MQLSAVNNNPDWFSSVFILAVWNFFQGQTGIQRETWMGIFAGADVQKLPAGDRATCWHRLSV